MAAASRISIVSAAASLPPTSELAVRSDQVAADNPESALFPVQCRRNVLRNDERIEQFVIDAAHSALAQAGLTTQDPDRLYGYVSVSEYYAPNGLYAVHRDLGLSDSCLVVPINSEFTNNIVGLLHAWEGMLTGHSHCALIASGTSWTRHVEPQHPHAVIISDAAAAMVVKRSDHGLAIVDVETETVSGEYGAMTMGVRGGGGRPTFLMNEAGVEAFRKTGHDAPVRLVRRLLARNEVLPSEVTLLSHQPASKILDYWNDQIQPKRHIHTFAENSNMEQSAALVNLAQYWNEIDTRYVVMFGLGIGAHNAGILLERH
jgi:3-oxoacyl-[acyl-carrier-protein] synthase-3